jgi:glucose/arabinose dehydrogenase
MNKLLKYLLIAGAVFVILAIVFLTIMSLYPQIKKSIGFSPTPGYATPLATFSPSVSTPIEHDTEEFPIGPPISTQAPVYARRPIVENYHWTLYTTGYNFPTYLTHANDESNRLFIIEKSGLIKIMEDGYKYLLPFIDIRDRVGSEAFEQGLLGLAFHPNYGQNGYFYLNYTDLLGNTIVARYQVSADPDIADAGSEFRILEIIQPYPNHNGGHLLFGPDGYLYIGMGDGGLYDDPHENGQNPETLLGKMLRIDIDAGTPYSIPDGNFHELNPAALPEIWAIGLRNPWRYSFDSLTEDLLIADVGQNDWEEINFISAGNHTNLNFGWDYYEGNHKFQNTPPDNADMVFPIAVYKHENELCSVAGGMVYRGDALPEWHGIYFYSDFCKGIIWGLWQTEIGGWENQELYNLNTYMTSFGEDENGELYFLTVDGAIFRLEAIK